MNNPTDRKEVMASSKSSETLFRDFFQLNPVATIVTSPSGLIFMVNPAFSNATGLAAEDVVGKNSQELGFWKNPADRERMVAAIKRDGFIDNLESTFYGKDKRLMTCLVSSRAVEFEGEVRILSIVLDITEQRKAEAALRQLAQAKSDFISTAAHELRTPLVAIIGYSELLECYPVAELTGEKARSYLSTIQSNAEILNRLVDDLLDVGRIQLGRSLGVVLEENRLAEIIDHAVASAEVRSSRHTMKVSHLCALPEVMMIDSERISQVLNNLLTNAIKFSPHGGVVELETITDREKVAVSIKDQGQGMSPEQVEHIFDRFYRPEKSVADGRGLGLGMSIVRQLIADHGGEIKVSSELGVGTIVSFTLPVKKQ